MPEVTIDLIKALRERTQAGIMDCKKALLANDGDIEKAVDYLREKGIVKAASKANRIAAEGLSQVLVDGNKAIIAEVNCETDFVSSGDKFHKLVDDVLSTIASKNPSSLDEAKKECEPLFIDATVAMGEKMELRRYEEVALSGSQKAYSYIHMGGKIGVLLILDKECDELGKGISMHIAANAPQYLDLSSVPAADRERELGVATAEVRDDPKLQNKPEAVKAQIVERKVDKTLSKDCLSLQEYLIDPSKTVGCILQEKGVSIVKFVRYKVGEGVAA